MRATTRWVCHSGKVLGHRYFKPTMVELQSCIVLNHTAFNYLCVTPGESYSYVNETCPQSYSHVDYFRW